LRGQRTRQHEQDEKRDKYEYTTSGPARLHQFS
jgi:hypothetical protein